MESNLRAKLRITLLIATTALITTLGIYGLIKPVQNGCAMTYMYPTYIPISFPTNLSSSIYSNNNINDKKYGLYLYHEGWQKIDFDQHLKAISGVPVLFIPGNGGSYKQVRSIAKESHWAYTNGPLEKTYYQEAPLSPVEGGLDEDAANFSPPNQYTSMLDWFAVDLEGEHSAMDGQILKEHTEYVVYAIHRILDQYRQSREARSKDGAAVSGDIPKSVILVGHSMGGFVARAAVVHPHLRKSAVETVITLSSPHQSPPVALQPSLGYYFASINQKWREGYQIQVPHARHHEARPALSHVVLISISGGINDYQVRSKLESLDDIVPPTHGFMISSIEMKNVWVSMEHQAILWCNQLIVQVSHTLLSLVDPETGRPFIDRQRRMVLLTKMLKSGLRQGPDLIRQSSRQPTTVVTDVNGSSSTGLLASAETGCPESVRWSDDTLERDLYIQTTTVTVLAMDGRRRWLDIQKLGSHGKSHFVLVTNLSPCRGIRIHLWPEKQRKSTDLPLSRRVLEVTSRLSQIPSGPAPRQIEPGSQTEQPPPSAVFWLDPETLKGFRFITISIAPRLTVSGRPPPAASMAVGQFINPEEGHKNFSPLSLLLSGYRQKDLLFKEDHPLALNLSFEVSLGLLPIKLSLKTAGCGIKESVFPDDDADHNKLCKLRCFPPVAIAWDQTSGLHVYPNFNSETIVVDSAPALWGSAQGSEKTSVLLLADPHCAYKTSYSVSITASAGRFLLLYYSKIVGLSIAVVFFALMQQARAWELDMPMPSMLTAVEYNMRPSPFLLMAGVPLLIPLLLAVLHVHPFPSVSSFVVVSLICYLSANGVVMILILMSQSVFYVVSAAHVFFKKRWQVQQGNICLAFLKRFISLTSRFSAFKVVRVIRSNPVLVTASAAIFLVCFVHPALGLCVLLLSHALCCHTALCSFLTASFRSLTHTKEYLNSKNVGLSSFDRIAYQRHGRSKPQLPSEENFNSGGSANSYSDMQLEVFRLRHGMLILHFLGTLMFAPSFAAWVQRLGIGYSFPWLLDSALCIGVILQGLSDSKPEMDLFVFSIPSLKGLEVRSSFIYLLAGYFSFLSGLALAPYRVFYPMAAIGVLSFIFRIVQKRNREKGEVIFNSRKHSHRH